MGYQRGVIPPSTIPLTAIFVLAPYQPDEALLELHKSEVLPPQPSCPPFTTGRPKLQFEGSSYLLELSLSFICLGCFLL